MVLARLSRWMEVVLVALLATLTLLATIELFAWVLLDRSFAPMEEIQGILMIWLGLLGAAYCLAERLHLAVDLLSRRLSATWSRGLLRLAAALTAVFGALLTLYGVRLVGAVSNTLPATGWSAATQYVPAVIAGGLIALVALAQFARPDRPAERDLSAQETGR